MCEWDSGSKDTSIAPASVRAGNPLGCQAAPVARRVNYRAAPGANCVCLIQSHINADKRSRFAAFIASRRRNEFIFNEFDLSLNTALHVSQHGLCPFVSLTSYIYESDKSGL